jgi:hypothetical protein
VGIDGTRAGFEAARQAARLVEPGARLLLVGVEDGSQGGPDRDDRMTHQPTRYRPVNQYRHCDVGG